MVQQWFLWEEKSSDFRRFLSSKTPPRLEPALTLSGGNDPRNCDIYEWRSVGWLGRKSIRTENRSLAISTSGGPICLRLGTRLERPNQHVGIEWRSPGHLFLVRKRTRHPRYRSCGCSLALRMRRSPSSQVLRRLPCPGRSAIRCHRRRLFCLATNTHYHRQMVGIVCPGQPTKLAAEWVWIGREQYDDRA